MQSQNELTRNAIGRARREELDVFQRALDRQWLDNRMEDGRMGRCLALIKREAEMEKAFQERTDHAAIVNDRARKETKLGMEVAKVRHDDSVELLRRHYLRERDPELRELMRKLQAGYVCRDLRQQIKNNEYRRLQEKAEEYHTNEVVLSSLGFGTSQTEEQELEKMKQNAQYRKELQQQLVARQQQRQCQYEDALIEQKMLDDVMRTIADEDQRELKQKRDLVERTRKEMDTFKQARAAWRAKQRVLGVQEETNIEKQLKELEERNFGIQAEKNRQMQIKEEINAKISAKLMADEAERQERENIIKQLQELELEEKNIQDEIAMSRKQKLVTNSTMTNLTAQMDLKKKHIQEEKQSEIVFRKEAEKTQAAIDAKEQEKERKKKEIAHQYSMDLKRQIEDNARRRKIEQHNEDARAKAVWDYNKDWDAEVLKERSKIVAEHVPSILGYIQPGVVVPGDVPALRGALAAGAASARAPHPKCNAQCRLLRKY